MFTLSVLILTALCVSVTQSAFCVLKTTCTSNCQWGTGNNWECSDNTTRTPGRYDDVIILPGSTALFSLSSFRIATINKLYVYGTLTLGIDGNNDVKLIVLSSLTVDGTLNTSAAQSEVIVDVRGDVKVGCNGFLAYTSANPENELLERRALHIGGSLFVSAGGFVDFGLVGLLPAPSVRPSYIAEGTVRGSSLQIAYGTFGSIRGTFNFQSITPASRTVTTVGTTNVVSASGVGSGGNSTFSSQTTSDSVNFVFAILGVHPHIWEIILGASLNAPLGKLKLSPANSDTALRLRQLTLSAQSVEIDCAVTTFVAVGGQVHDTRIYGTFKVGNFSGIPSPRPLRVSTSTSTNTILRFPGANPVNVAAVNNNDFYPNWRSANANCSS